MRTYKMIAKYEGDPSPDFGFTAMNQKEADNRAFTWNRYHGKSNSPGWGWSIAVETDENIEVHNDWL